MARLRQGLVLAVIFSVLQLVVICTGAGVSKAAGGSAQLLQMAAASRQQQPVQPSKLGAARPALKPTSAAPAGKQTVAGPGNKSSDAGSRGKRTIASPAVKPSNARVSGPPPSKVPAAVPISSPKVSAPSQPGSNRSPAPAQMTSVKQTGLPAAVPSVDRLVFESAKVSAPGTSTAMLQPPVSKGPVPMPSGPLPAPVQVASAKGANGVASGSASGSSVLGSSMNFVPSSSAGPMSGPAPVRSPTPGLVDLIKDMLFKNKAINATPNSTAAWPADTTGSPYVYRKGSKLLLAGRPFYFVGFNAYWMPKAAAYGPRDKVDQVLARTQALGLKVVRAWGFGPGLPSSPGTYSPQELEGMDYFLAAAKRAGMKVVLALGNFWNAYRGPEEWITQVTGTLEGKDVTEFYKDRRVVAAYKQHITTMTSRINSLTGLAYSQDATIMAWDVLNEPRCPGCDQDDAAMHLSWLGEVADHVKASAPNHLVWVGGEGFFKATSPYVSSNPGAGATCEGEDFVEEASLPSIDAGTVHVYERQMEGVRELGWRTPSLEQYFNLMYNKVQVYQAAASRVGRPLIVEEFGLSRNLFPEKVDRAVVFTIMYQLLLASQVSGSPLMGAMFWGAHWTGSGTNDGYSLFLDQPFTVNTSFSIWPLPAAPGNANLGAASRRLKGWQPQLSVPLPVAAAGSTAQAATSLLMDVEQLAAGADSSLQGLLLGSMPDIPGSNIDNAVDIAGQDISSAPCDPLGGSGCSKDPCAAIFTGARQQSRLLMAELSPDVVFRRQAQRNACAHEASYWFSMYLPSGPVDAAAYRARLQGLNIRDVIAAAGRQLQ